MAYGQSSNIGISFQNSYGTLLTNSVYWMPHLSDSVGKNIEQLMSESMRGIYDEGETYEGKNTSDGDLEFEVQPIPVGVILKAMFGEPTSVNSGAIYSHTFKPRNSDFDELSAADPITYHQYLDTGSAQLHYDLNANTLEMSVAQGELLKMTCGFVGGNFQQVAGISPSYPNEKHFTWDATSLSIGGSGKNEILDISISVDETLEAMFTLDGTKTPSRVKRTGLRTIEVSGTLKFDNQNEYQEFLTQSERELIATFTGATEIQSGYYDTIEVKMPKLRYGELKPSAGGAGQIEASFTGKAKYSVSSATAMQILLVNTQAAY